MDHHEINMTGRYWAQEVSSLPTWHPSYYRRIIYYNNGLYVGKAGGWHQIAEGTNVFDLDDLNTQYHVGTLAPSADDAGIDLGASSYQYSNVYAVNFQGVTTTATYADLAEKYTMEKDWPVGTILAVSKNEEYELEPAEFASFRVAGVRSEKYGFLMNAKAEGYAVGLVGKVPIRIFGRIKKGDLVRPFDGGLGMKTDQKETAMAISLETCNKDGVNLVLCLLKL